VSPLHCGERTVADCMLSDKMLTNWKGDMLYGDGDGAETPGAPLCEDDADIGGGDDGL
jgi:hypothetical protein